MLELQTAAVVSDKGLKKPVKHNSNVETVYVFECLPVCMFSCLPVC